MRPIGSAEYVVIPVVREGGQDPAGYYFIAGEIEIFSPPIT